MPKHSGVRRKGIVRGGKIGGKMAACKVANVGGPGGIMSTDLQADSGSGRIGSAAKGALVGLGEGTADGCGNLSNLHVSANVSLKA